MTPAEREALTAEQIRANAAEARVRELEAAIREHRDQRGDDRCWLDDVVLYRMLPESGDGNIDLTLPPRQEFLKSCERFWAQRQCKRVDR